MEKMILLIKADDNIWNLEKEKKRFKKSMGSMYKVSYRDIYYYVYNPLYFNFERICKKIINNYHFNYYNLNLRKYYEEDPSDKIYLDIEFLYTDSIYDEDDKKDALRECGYLKKLLLNIVKEGMFVYEAEKDLTKDFVCDACYCRYNIYKNIYPKIIDDINKEEITKEKENSDDKEI